MGFYRAALQMSVCLHEHKIHSVETKIELPDFYQPQAGSILNCSMLGGRQIISMVCYDVDNSEVIISLLAGGYDPTTTIDEWLKGHPKWKLCTTPIVECPHPGIKGYGSGKPETAENYGPPSDEEGEYDDESTQPDNEDDDDNDGNPHSPFSNS